MLGGKRTINIFFHTTNEWVDLASTRRTELIRAKLHCAAHKDGQRQRKGGWLVCYAVDLEGIILILCRASTAILSHIDIKLALRCR
jgi:hypothetical protein